MSLRVLVTRLPSSLTEWLGPEQPSRLVSTGIGDQKVDHSNAPPAPSPAGMIVEQDRAGIGEAGWWRGAVW
jgi:hypothetical protein